MEIKLGSESGQSLPLFPDPSRVDSLLDQAHMQSTDKALPIPHPVKTLCEWQYEINQYTFAQKGPAGFHQLRLISPVGGITYDGAPCDPFAPGTIRHIPLSVQIDLDKARSLLIGENIVPILFKRENAHP
jgi:hypothetical protein